MDFYIVKVGFSIKHIKFGTEKDQKFSLYPTDLTLNENIRKVDTPFCTSCTCAYQRERNVSFSENFGYVLNGWPTILATFDLFEVLVVFRIKTNVHGIFWLEAKVINFWKVYVMLCAIWYQFCNLKNVKNTHGEVKSITPSWVFSQFLNCTNVTKLRKVARITSETK